VGDIFFEMVLNSIYFWGFEGRAMRVSFRERRLDRGGIQNTPPNPNISKSQILLPPAKLEGVCSLECVQVV